MARLLQHAGEELFRQRLERMGAGDLASRVYCPFCLLQDLKSNPTCLRPTSLAAVLVHDLRIAWCSTEESDTAAARYCTTTWSRAELIEDADTLAADRYRAIKVSREPRLRYALLGCLLELERAVEAACAGVAPNPLIWGPLSAQDFLNVLRDVTTWSLNAFPTGSFLVHGRRPHPGGGAGRLRTIGSDAIDMIASDYPRIDPFERFRMW